MIAGMIAPEGLITQVEKEMGVYLTSFWGASEVGPGLGTMCPLSFAARYPRKIYRPTGERHPHAGCGSRHP